jgi:Purple acid Phosphatase, N-terminal domain
MAAILLAALASACAMSATLAAPFAYPAQKTVPLWEHRVGAPAAEPFHLRLAYGTQPESQMWVSWTSFDGTSPAEVLYGLASDDYSATVEAQTPVTYGPEDTCGKQRYVLLARVVLRLRGSRTPAQRVARPRLFPPRAVDGT